MKRSYLLVKKGGTGKKAPIDEIKYLPRLIMIAYLSNNTLTIADGLNLTPVEEFKTLKVITFCLNMALYRGAAHGDKGD